MPTDELKLFCVTVFAFHLYARCGEAEPMQLVSSSLRIQVEAFVMSMLGLLSQSMVHAPSHMATVFSWLDKHVVCQCLQICAW